VRRSVVAVAVSAALALVAGAAPAGAGPVKHWGTFPGREVRAVAMRGERFGGENRYSALQGRDGYVYVRGRLYLYRVLDEDGRTEAVADTSRCSGWFESQGIDERTRVPRALCTRAAQIIVASATRHQHIRIPTPAWSGAFRYVGQDRVDNRYLTSVVPAAGGGYWYGFAVPGAVGRVWPSGRTVLRHIPGLGKVQMIAAAGNDVYVADDRCRVAHLRALVLLDLHDYDCSSYWNWNRSAVTRTSDGAVWILSPGDGTVERRRGDGTRAHWNVGMSPASVAVARDGTAYVLGVARGGRDAHPVIATIAPGRAPKVRVLPMRYAETIAIDGRDRIWISDPFDHAFAVIAPTAREKA
jgi:hypothetical protein